MDTKAGVSLVVQSARAAAETADDARMIAARREQENRVATAEQQAAQAQGAVAQAQAEAQQARAEADAARAQAESERTARRQAESQAAAAPSSQDLPVAPPPPSTATPQIAYRGQADSNTQPQQQMRMRMLERLNAVVATRDTPRGLVVTLADSGFDNGTLRPASVDTLARLAPVLMQSGVHVSVEGFSDSAAGSVMSQRRAEAVADTLAGRGVRSVSARNFGDSRPLTSSATPEGRVENRRVEIVVSSDSIGSMPLWDRSYNVTLR
jgi:outer membrane protein OmpA-like peptidoglycan-associated protein